MTTMKTFINRRPLLIYFILTFAISWGAILAAVGFDGIPVTPDQAVALGMAILLGPSIASILLTGLASGKSGLYELFSRLRKWRVGARWYAVALLTAPLATVVTLLTLSLFSNEFTPSIFTSDSKSTLVMMGVVAGLAVGFFEELGWTGFAIPRMRSEYGIFTTGLIVGLLWGAWHFLLFWESDSFSGFVPLMLLLARLFSWLPAYRILMVWVYDHTGSMLVVILMHMSLVATLMVIDPLLTGKSLLTFIVARAVVLWILAAAVSAIDRRTAREEVTKWATQRESLDA